MLTMIIGFGIGVLLWCLVLKYISDDNIAASIDILALLIVVASIMLGFFAPLQGYQKEAILQREVELISLNNATASEGHGNLFYVSVSGENVYSYRYEVEDNYGVSGKSYKVATVSENVTEIESKDCSKPVLRVYKRKAKKGIFTFALFDSRKEYVFYVPEGTIVKDIKLN